MTSTLAGLDMDEKEPHSIDTSDWQATIALERFAAIDQDFVTFRRFEKLQRYNLLRLHQQLTNCLGMVVKEEEEGIPDFIRIRDTVLKASPLLKEYSTSSFTKDPIRDALPAKCFCRCRASRLQECTPTA